MIRHRLRLVAAVLAISACTSQRFKDEAIDQFVREYTCPADRVTATERTDLKASAEIHTRRAPPPDEIARDPERLAIWNAEDEKTIAYYDKNYRCIEVRGCDHRELVCCTDADVGGVMCMESNQSKQAQPE